MHIATAPTTAIDYELLVSSLPGLYLILAPDLTIINVSDAYLRSTSMVRSEVIGRRLFEVLPENPAVAESKCGNTLKKSLLHVLNFNTAHTVPVLRYDIPRPKKLGGGFEERYWMTANHPVCDKKGKLLYIVHHVTDVTAQQMAHRQINTHRERYEVLAQAGADVTWDWDLLNNHIWWSEGFEPVFGYHPHDFSNIEDWVQKVHPEDKENVIKGIYETEEMGGKVWTDSYRFLKADGTYAHVMERGFLLRDDNGVAYRMVGSMFDISEHIKAARNGKTSHENYQKILDAMPNLAWCIKPGADLKTGTSYYNKAWQEYTGLATDLLNGAAKVMHADDLVPATTKLTRSLQQQHTYEEEIRLKNYETGDYRWFLSRAVPIRDEKGNVSLWFGTCTDINDRKVRPEKPAPKENYWKKILTEAPVNVAVFQGPEHICEFTSPGFKKLLGNRRTDKMPLFAICPEMTDQGFIAVLDTVFETGQPVTQGRFAMLSEGGEKGIFYNFTFQPLLSATGQTETIVVVATEIPQSETSEVKTAENTALNPVPVSETPEMPALQAAKNGLTETREPGEILARALQHLQKPVNNLEALFEELTHSAQFTDPEASQLVSLFRKNLAQAQSTLTTLPEILAAPVKPEKAQEPICLQKVANEVLSQLQETITLTGARISTHFKTPTAWILEKDLRQILQTLVLNSLQFKGGRKPEITISSQTLNNFTVLSVQDNGCGIDLARHGNHLFQPFGRLQKTGSGNGLGLYLLHRTVTSLGGRVETESTPDQGTTFKIWLKNPVTAVLLIEENETAGFLRKRLFYRVEPTADVTVKTTLPEALHYLETASATDNKVPDLILLDLETAGPEAAAFLEKFATLKPTFSKQPEIMLLATTGTLETKGLNAFPDHRIIAGSLDETAVKEIMQELLTA